MRLICICGCVGSSYWFYYDYVLVRMSPDVPTRDLSRSIHCYLPEEYRTQPNDSQTVECYFKGRSTRYESYCDS